MFVNEEIRKRAKDILDKMSLTEKVGQLNQEHCNITNVANIEELKEDVRKGLIGSVILANSATAGNDKQEKTMISAINELERISVEESPSGIPIIFGRDVIHGHETVLPIPIAMAASFNPEIVKDGYHCVAKEAANDGINWTFSPMIDISRDPRWGRCVEGIGEDPYLGEKMAEAVIAGFQGDDYTKRDSIAACAKHYIGYGAAEGGRDYHKTEISDYTLRNYYLKPFKAAVDSGVATVMNSFNDLNGQPTTSNRYLLHDLLKEELGFEGFVVSDWGTVHRLMEHGVAANPKEAAEKAINAGLDMDMAVKIYKEQLETLVNEGKVSMETLDEAVLRVLYIKLMFGLFENPYAEYVPVDNDEHMRKAQNCSDEAMLLLKNNDNILPLKDDEKILVTGPLMHEKRTLLGTWTLDGDLNKVKTIAETLTERSKKVFLAHPYLWDDALIDARRADKVVMVLGETCRVTGEKGSLSKLELTSEQTEFARKMKHIGKKVVAVICSGRPLALEEAEPYFDAVLYAWHSGTCTAQSVAAALYGDINPSARVPMTFPRSTGQVPVYYNVSQSPCNTYYEDGIYGRYYSDQFTTPLYQFGYGLSYTTFDYSEPECKKAELTLEEIETGVNFEITVKVKNTGNLDGKEVVQCYIHDDVASMSRPVKELKGFSKEMYKAGEEKTITFKLGRDELAFYNANAEFKVEKGSFTVYVGKDCYTQSSVKINVI